MSSDLAVLQNHVHSSLQSLINGGRSVGYPMFYGPRWKRQADRLIRDYSNLTGALGELSDPGAKTSDIRVQDYAGENSHVAAMKTLIGHDFDEDELVGAYVHGSLGVYEINAYADFDALVILRSDVFDSVERFQSVARRLYRAQSIMLNMDPIQHHGWFVLTEADLAFYCDNYFPVGLFSHARSIGPQPGQTLLVRKRCCTKEIEYSFRTLARQVSAGIMAIEGSRNAFLIKSILSQFMLLPAFYLQVINGEGIFKRESFVLARERLPSADWSAMDTASRIRAEWRYHISAHQRRLLARPGLLRKITLRFIPPILESGVTQGLNHSFFRSVQCLIRELIADVDCTIGGRAPVRSGVQA